MAEKNSSCEYIETLMFDYIDNELSKDEMLKLEKHVSGCEKCREELRSRQKLINLIQDSAYEPENDIYEAVMNKIEKIEKNEKSKKSKSKRGLFYSLGTIAAAAAVFVIMFVNRDMLEMYIGNTDKSAAGEVTESAENIEQLYDDVSSIEPDFKMPGENSVGGELPKMSLYCAPETVPIRELLGEYGVFDYMVTAEKLYVISEEQSDLKAVKGYVETVETDKGVSYIYVSSDETSKIFNETLNYSEFYYQVVEGDSAYIVVIVTK